MKHIRVQVQSSSNLHVTRLELRVVELRLNVALKSGIALWLANADTTLMAIPLR